MGEPVVIGPLEQSRARTLQRIHRFNLLASDRIPLNRTLPDIRKDASVLLPCFFFFFFCFRATMD